MTVVCASCFVSSHHVTLLFLITCTFDCSCYIQLVVNAMRHTNESVRIENDGPTYLLHNSQLWREETRKREKNRSRTTKDPANIDNQSHAISGGLIVSIPSRHPQELDSEQQSHVCLCVGLTGQINDAIEDRGININERHMIVSSRKNHLKSHRPEQRT